MAWSWLTPDKTPFLRGKQVLLRPPTYTDYAAWYGLRSKSRDFLRPFEPRWTEADLAQRVFAARVKRARQEADEGTDYSYFIFLPDSPHEKLVGGITLSNVRRRAAQHCTLGYWMGQDYAGRGLMTEAVATTLPYVFNTLDLHRVHAAFLPGNLASRRVLEKNGFVEEGYAENYLQIDGRWADHVLFGLTREGYERFRYQR
ncbi:GNAT family protein [Devosia algicola]|uniref:GNAT family protein n=1 Tax=Devosia algicola TaxID=3026418 RepID=A0ABY7YMU5_9HYPH|nr:GNAT family protein [Devosia algicola]WDR02512.1 GNAT family protein [Devosia algicola]